MDRHRVWHKMTWALAVAVAMIATVGCTNFLLTAVYLFKGDDDDAKFTGLNGKKVAVVCRPLASLQDGGVNVSRELAQQVAVLLNQNEPKIKTIDQQKIAKWTDENAWDEFNEVGKAMKADMVVGIDLESFSLYKGQTVYQGRATAKVTVYDCKTHKKVFDTHLPQVLFPPNGGIEYVHAVRGRLPPQVPLRARRARRPQLLSPRPLLRRGQDTAVLDE